MAFSVGLGVNAGNYTITVAGTSAGVTENTTVSLVVTSAPPANFTLGASPSSLTVQPGASGTVSLTVTPEYGFNSAVSFACSGLPAGVTCSFSPTAVTPTSGNAATTQLTFTASSTASAHPSHPRPWLPVASLATLFCAFLLRRRSAVRQWLMLIALVGALGFVSACGGGGSSSSSGGSGGTPESATVTITATSGAIVQTSTIALTVN